MKSLRQIAAVTLMNLRALRGRIALSLVIVTGMAMVVGVTLSLLSMSRGLTRLAENTGEPDRVIILAHDTQNEGQSNVPRSAALTILDLPGIKRNSAGEALVSTDVITFIPTIKKSDGLSSFTQLRGVSKNFFALHPEIRLASGRTFTPALHEIIVGRQVAEQFVGHELGDDVSLPEGDWKVVGVFDSDGSWSSSIITDAETLMDAYHRTGFNSVTARIDPGDAAYAAFKDALTTNPNLSVGPQTETAYYAKTLGDTNRFLKLIAYWVGGVMGLGAVFGALNTMYSAVSTRTIEIATLRAIGFGPAPVVISIAAESLLLSVAGAAIGAIAAWTGFNGKSHLFGNLSIPLTIDGQVFLVALVLALVIGLVGALFPAIRAARIPVTTALQAR